MICENQFNMDADEISDINKLLLILSLIIILWLSLKTQTKIFTNGIIWYYNMEQYGIHEGGYE